MRQGYNSIIIVHSGGPSGPSRVGEFQGGTPTGQTRRSGVLGGSGTQGGESPLAQACRIPGADTNRRPPTPNLAQDQRAEGGLNTGPLLKPTL